MTAILPWPRKRPARKNPAPAAQAAPVAPPSGALINAILSYADVEEDLGGGLALLRLSADRARDPVVRDMLGREARRLADVSIVWNDAQSEIHSVLDATRPLDETDLWGEPQFELTDLALAWLEETGAEGRRDAG